MASTILHNYITNNSLNAQINDQIFIGPIFLNTAISKIDALIQSPRIFPESLAEHQLKIDSLNKYVSVISSSSLKSFRDNKDQVHKLFFQTLLPFEYDRSAIRCRSPLESILDQEIYSADDQKDSIDPVTHRNIRRTLLEAVFANRLGVKPENARSSYHVVFYILDRHKNRLGVFKPRIDIPPLEDNYGGAEEREAHLSEVASSQIDQYLQTDLVPYTTLLTLPFITPLEGSFQFYAPNAPALETFLEGENLFDPNHKDLQNRLDTEKNNNLILKNFETFALFDLIKAETVA